MEILVWLTAGPRASLCLAKTAIPLGLWHKEGNAATTSGAGPFDRGRFSDAAIKHRAFETAIDGAGCALIGRSSQGCRFRRSFVESAAANPRSSSHEMTVNLPISK